MCDHNHTQKTCDGCEKPIEKAHARHGELSFCVLVISASLHVWSAQVVAKAPILIRVLLQHYVKRAKIKIACVLIVKNHFQEHLKLLMVMLFVGHALLKGKNLNLAHYVIKCLCDYPKLQK